MRARVPVELDGERADLVVARVAEVSRSVARQLLTDGGALVDGATVAPRDRLAAGMQIDFELPEPLPQVEAEAVDFGVRYEDEYLAVIEKPAGLVVHPGAGRRTGTLASGMMHRWPQVEGVGEAGRWGIVHRLDRDTSGLLVVALDAGSFEGLQDAMSRREITRVYLALVHGRGIPPTGTIDAPLGRDPRHPTRFRVQRAGRPARTHYRNLAAWDGPGLTLLEVHLETGRTHQIRVHTASIGYPVAGDPAYGRGGDGIPRLWLHAARLALVHPITGEDLEVTSELPADLRGVLERLGPPSSGEVPAD